MAFRKPDEIAEAAIEAGMKKIKAPAAVTACAGVFRRCIYRAWVFA